MGEDKGSSRHVKLTWPLPIGTKIRTTFGNSRDKLYHVRGIVDDMLVIRWWRKGKRRWEYDVFDDTWLNVYRKHLDVELPKCQKKKTSTTP